MNAREAAAAIYSLAHDLDANGYHMQADALQREALSLEMEADAQDEEDFDWRDLADGHERYN